MEITPILIYQYVAMCTFVASMYSLAKDIVLSSTKRFFMSLIIAISWPVLLPMKVIYLILDKE